MRLIKKIFTPLITAFLIIRHGSIWKLKKHIKQHSLSGMYIVAYDYFFSRMGSYVSVNCGLDEGIPCFPHGVYGIYISSGTKIGQNSVIFQQVTIGSNTLNRSKNIGSPIIGKNVYIGAGAKIIGNIVIGDNCRIGANAVVYRDMPSHSVAVQSETRLIQKADLDNRYFTYKQGNKVFYDDGCWIPSDNK